MIVAVKRTLYAIAALVFSAQGLWAQGTPTEDLFSQGEINLEAPAASRRISARFDFDTTPEASAVLPERWIRAQHDPPARIRPTFPIWNRGVLDPDVAFSGTGSVRLDIEGGSASLLLDPGVIQVFPDADYSVIARVRTLSVIHARARLIARLIDGNGNIIPESEVSSEPIKSDGRWLPVSIRIPGDFIEATSLQIEMVLEQPGTDPDFPFKDLQITRQDYQGSAWFDELAVIQIPRIEAWIDRPGNLIPSDGVPEIGVFVRDLVAEPLEVIFEITDPDGVVIDQKTSKFNGGRLETTWTPMIDRFGWYRATVSVQRQGARIGSAQTAFVWRPSIREGSGRPSARSGSPFSISVHRVPDTGLEQLGNLALIGGFPRTLTGLYDGDLPLNHERVEALGDLANLLARKGSELGLAVPSLPPDVSAISGPTPVLRAIADGSADGAAWIEPVLVDLGHRVRWWRVGSFDEAIDGLAVSYAQAASDRLRDLVPGAVLELPWSAFDAVHPASVRTGLAIAQEILPSISPGEIPALLSGFSEIANNAEAGYDRPEQTAVFRTDGHGKREIDEAVLGVLHAWVGFDMDGKGPARGRSARLDAGWAWQEGRKPQLVPAPSAAAWFTVMDMLSGRRGELLERVAPGVSGLLLTPLPTSPERTEPVAVFWTEAGPDQQASLRLLLAPGTVRVIDVFGNSEQIEPGTLPQSNVRAHEVDLSGGVVFVEGVDADLLRYLSSVHLDPGRVQSDTDPHAAELTMTNPWGSSVLGEFFIVEPGGLSTGGRATQDRRWKITPRFGPFAMGPAVEERLEISFDVSPAVGAGPAPLVVDIDLSAPSVTEFVRVERTLNVGLEHIRLHVVAGYEPDPFGDDLVVYAIVENAGIKPENISLSVSAPGYNRQRSAATPAQPGRRVIKSFAYPGGRSLLAGKEVVVGMTIRENGSRLRKSIRIDGGP